MIKVREKMEPPTPPRYEDFGLTRMSYRDAPGPKLENLDIDVIRASTLAWLWGALVLFVLWTDGLTNFKIWVGKLFYALICALVFVVVFVMLVFYPLQALEKTLYQMLSPRYRKKARYDEADKKYHEDQQIYEDWRNPSLRGQAGGGDHKTHRLVAGKT